MENPYAAPQAEIAVPTGVKAAPLTWKQILFSFKGRIPRRTYWGYNILTGVVSGVISAFLQNEDGTPTTASLVASLPFYWVSFAIAAKRWHDRNKSGWWSLMLFVPIIVAGVLMAVVAGTAGGSPEAFKTGMQSMLGILMVTGGLMIIAGIWTFVECGCLRGTEGANKYGEDPT